MTTTRHAGLIALTAAALAPLAGAAIAQDAPTPMLVVDGATYKGDTLTIPEVALDKPGYLVVHDSLDGAPVVPDSIVHVPLEGGEAKLVAVPVAGLESGKEYFVMLHYETNGNTSYDFGPGSTDVDTPVMTAEGTPLMMAIKAE